MTRPHIHAFAFVLGFPVLLLGCAWLYWPGLAGPFIFDDFPNLENLRELQGEWNWRNLGAYLGAFHGNPGRPLAALSFLLNDAAWPTDPRGFKYTNLCLHLLCGIAVLGLARSLHRASAKSATPSAVGLAVALVAAAAWLLHPIHVTAVLQVVQRMTLLSALFVLGGVWAYAALLQRARSVLGAILALAALGFATVLAFLCKENGALAPMYAWVLQATVLRSTVDALPRQARRLLRIAIPVAACLPFLAFIAQPGAWMDFSNREYTLGQRLLTQPRVLLDYLHAIAVPRLAGGGSLFHDDYLVSTSLLTPVTTLVGVVSVIAMLMAGVLMRKSQPWLSLALLWFLAGHSIEAGFVSLELYFEHRNYLPYVGIAIALANGGMAAARHSRIAATLLLTGWLAICSFVTHQHARVWADGMLMAETWATENPTSRRAHYQLALSIFEQGDLAGARALFDRWGQRENDNRNASLYVLVVDCYADAHVSTEQLRQLRTDLREDLPDTTTFSLLTRLRERATTQDCANFTLQQWVELSDALLENPRAHSLHALHDERAQAFQSQGRFAPTITALIAAYEAEPTPERARSIAALFLSGGLHDEARRWAMVARDMQTPIFKRWVSQQRERGEELVTAIDHTLMNSARRRDGSVSGTEEPGTRVPTGERSQ